MGVPEILSGYAQKEAALNALRRRIGELEEEARAASAGMGFVQNIAEPLGEAVAAILGADRVEVYGPFGLNGETTLDFSSGTERVGWLTIDPHITGDGYIRYSSVRPSDAAASPVRWEVLPDGFEAVASLARELAGPREV